MQNLVDDPDYIEKISERDTIRLQTDKIRDDHLFDSYLLNIKTLRQFHQDLQDEQLRAKQMQFHIENHASYKFKYVVPEDDVYLIRKASNYNFQKLAQEVDQEKYK